MVSPVEKRVFSVEAGDGEEPALELTGGKTIMKLHLTDTEKDRLYQDLKALAGDNRFFAAFTKGTRWYLKSFVTALKVRFSIFFFAILWSHCQVFSPRQSQPRQHADVDHVGNDATCRCIRSLIPALILAPDTYP
jgi:hypothetical protein